MNDNFYSNARAFVATIRAGTMTAAAHELKTTKSGVSQKVSHLETDLGLKLLDRSGRSVNATAAGQRIFDICAPMIDAALEAEARLGEGFGETLSGRVAISGPNSFLTSVIMPIVAKFTPEHPDVRIEIKASDWNVDFAAADIDLGFRIGETPKGRFIMKRLMTAKRQLCASADLLKRHPAIDCPLGLADVPCVLRHQEARSWSLSGPEGVVETIEPQRALLTDTMELSQSAAVAGLGVAMLPSLSAQPDIDAGKLVSVLPQWSSEAVDVTLLSRPNSLPKPQVAAMRRFFIERLGEAAR